MLRVKDILLFLTYRIVFLLFSILICNNLYSQREITLPGFETIYEEFLDTDSVLIVHPYTSYASSQSSSGSTLVLRNQFNARFKVTVYCSLETSNAYLDIITDSVVSVHNKKTLRTYDTIIDNVSAYSYLKLYFLRNNVQGNTGSFVAYISLVCLDDLDIVGLSSNSMVLSWDDYTFLPNNYSVVYNKVGSNVYDTIHTNNTGIQLNNLENNSSYFVTVFDDYGNSISRRFRTFCEEDVFSENDFSNLYSCNVTCRYGSFHHPDTSIGIIDKGMFSEDTRHCTNIGIEDSLDERTNYQLRIIPEGENYSIRLGNWYWGKEEESITYKYVVDTLRYDLLLLKYAAVLQNPGHNDNRQPRFKFQILDEDGNEINPTCYSADFVSNTALGWNIIETSATTILWKDWTTIGIDITPLQGQTIYIKLTTFDCWEGLHYGYAYFILKEDFKNISSDKCASERATHFSVPEGFNYRWYKEESPDVIISDKRTVEVTEDGTYIVECYFIGAGDMDDTSCSFICKATAGTRFPKADFSYRILERDEDSCITKVQFYNNSFVARDSLLTDITNEQCENFIWDFGDGSFSTERSPVHDYEHQFAYNVKLTAFIANDECSNEKDSLIHLLTCYNIDTTIIDLCKDSSYFWEDTIIKTGGIFFKEVDKYHAKMLIAINRPYYDTTIYRKICSNEEYNGLNTSGIYIDSLQSEYGCDSIIRLNLEVFPYKDTNLDIHICDGDYYYFNGEQIIKDGNYLYQGLTSDGCDSIVHLELTVDKNSNDSVYIEVFGENIYEGYGFIEESSGFYSHYSQSYNGCDSTFTLHLVFHKNPIVWIPNAFTPMQETNNILLLYPNRDVDEIHSFEIFSRWGTKVFETDDINLGWDGKYKGEYCPQGVYAYKVLYIGTDNLMYEKTGEIMLLY